MASIKLPAQVDLEHSDTLLGHLDELLNELMDMDVIVQYADHKVGAGIGMRYDWYSKTMALSPGAAAEGFQFVYATKTRPVNEPQPQLSMLGFKENITMEEAYATDLPTELPLVLNSLTPEIQNIFGWHDYPNVALQGLHGFDGEAAADALRAGIPVSNTSNPKDLDLLFAMHSYPAHKCFLLRDRGFVILGANVADVKATLRMLAPLLRSPASDAGVDSTDEDGVSNGSKPIGLLKRMFSWRGSNDGTSGAAPAATPPSSVSPTLGSSMPGSLPGSFPTNSLPPSMDENSDEALVAGMKVRPPGRASGEMHKLPSFHTGIRPW